jgi:hypothetical protein
MTKEQQPFWGVGRLRLSVIGFAEPRLGKLQRSTPFCIHAKFGSVHYDLTRVELLKTYHINQGEKNEIKNHCTGGTYFSAFACWLQV